MSDRAASPLVTAHQWGRVEVAGFGSFKDVLLTPGGAQEWDWKETVTRHRPGVLAPVVDLLAGCGATTLVLSQGVDGVLLVPDETVAYADSLGLEVHVARTVAAIAIYNALAAQGSVVAAALHSTC